MEKSKRCIVIGASAGGVGTLQEVVSKLPEDLRVPVFVVLHIPPYATSILPTILGRAGPLPAVHPRDGEEIRGGVIYVAPPDQHLLVSGGTIAVKRGPKENRFRPSVDALFRSAAYTYGPGAVGVVLSGALDDGTSGLWSIKRLGGIAIIQQPQEATHGCMPRSALEYVKPDHLLPASEMGSLLGSLVIGKTPEETAVEPEIKTLMGKEVDIAADGGAFQKGIMDLGAFTPFTCPECHGSLVKLDEGQMSRYRCHTGHAYTDSALLDGVMAATGEMLWQVIRSMEEGVMLLKNMAENLRQAGDPERAEIFFEKARKIEDRSKTFHQVALNHESLSGDNLGQGSKG